ncbi:uncharacterized protein LOC120656693 [Panicum virgatum]|uniref:Uncharacterized protein n=1 Tax=Panicum virgatum TaxID=38727 RepID=A0A8T0WY93_PANVG|nr:uncharacterized protein LOC120656693 [Panicum virgatum]KAG2652810.1 hypothetical protein PVAP13_1NG381400 [Panicum virgatum]
MRNPPGRHLLRLTNRAVRSSSSTSSGLGAGAGASTSIASPRSRTAAGGLPLRASSPPPPSAVAAAAYWESRAFRPDGEEGDWEEVVPGAPGPGEMEEEEEYRVVFWSPPTIDEVAGAVTSIQEVFENPFGVDSDTTNRQTALLSTSGHSSGNSSGSDDWIEPAAYVLNSTALLSREHRHVLDAFRLLQKDPTVQKMVMSLSCDKAVWNAVMNNEAVQDFRRSLHDGKENDRKGGAGGPSEVLKWILDSAQTKILEFLDNVMKIFNMLIRPQEDEEKPDAYSDAVKVSFMLTVFVFIVVAIARINCEHWDFKVW